jgi:5-methylcytosine-specific restriction endonuclease McrA
MRGTSNRNVRGNTVDRARRRVWLLLSFQSNRGPGTARCFRCGKVLTENTITVDRIVPGCHGGTYARNNIRPACEPCNRETGSSIRSKG